MNDADWLKQNRELHNMTQSNIASYLEVVTGENVNQGRVVSIEHGDMEIPVDWRQVLVPLFDTLKVGWGIEGITWRAFVPIMLRSRGLA